MPGNPAGPSAAADPETPLKTCGLEGSGQAKVFPTVSTGTLEVRPSPPEAAPPAPS